MTHFYETLELNQDKALNFSSKLVMVEVQLGIEKDKNEKLLKNIKEIRDVHQARNSTLKQDAVFQAPTV